MWNLGHRQQDHCWAVMLFRWTWFIIIQNINSCTYPTPRVFFFSFRSGAKQLLSVAMLPHYYINKNTQQTNMQNVVVISIICSLALPTFVSDIFIYFEFSRVKPICIKYETWKKNTPSPKKKKTFFLLFRSQVGWTQQLVTAAKERKKSGARTCKREYSHYDAAGH